MSLNYIQSKILKPFIDETLTSLEKMAGMNGHSDEGFKDDIEKFRFKGYAVCAKTSGTIDGVILMHHYLETAVALGNAVRKNVLDEDSQYDEINDLMADTLAEWGNTIIGRATNYLSSSSLGIDFEPPYFIFDTDAMAPLLKDITDVISVPVHVDGIGRFYFNYLIKKVWAELSDSEDAVSESEPTSQTLDHAVVLDHQANRHLSKDKKILIVDDMKMVRSSMKRFLSTMGYENIVEAVNGLDAVEKVKQEAPDFMFMDVVMPELNGNEALRQIREDNGQIPIVMLTSVADQSIIEECKSLGIDGYIIKPLTKESGPEALSHFLK